MLVSQGLETLEWELAINGIQDLRVTPRSGTVPASALSILTLEFESVRMQSRAEPYVGNITLTALGGTVCKCRTQSRVIAVSITVDAVAHANNSKFSLTNPDSVIGKVPPPHAI